MNKSRTLTKAQIVELKGVLSEIVPNGLAINFLLNKKNQWLVWQAYVDQVLLEIPDHLNKAGYDEPKNIRVDFTDVRALSVADEIGVTENEIKPKRTRGKSKSPVKRVTSVALEPDMYEQLEAISVSEDRSLGSIIRLAINFYLENKKR